MARVNIYAISWLICALNLITAALSIYQGRLNQRYRSAMLKDYVAIQKRIFELEKIIYTRQLHEIAKREEEPH